MGYGRFSALPKSTGFSRDCHGSGVCGKHHFKAAALKKTIAFPVEPDFNLGDPRLLIGLLILSLTALVDARRSSQRGKIDSYIFR